MRLGRGVGSEVRTLDAGMDFRRPEYRREVFHKFYELHTRWMAHPGIVYLLLPFMVHQLDLDAEDALWLAWLNGNTQNPVTSYLIMREFPHLGDLDFNRLVTWWNANWARLAFDTDRRYWKGRFCEAVEDYQSQLEGWTQVNYFRALCASLDEATNWRAAWGKVRRDFFGFGRLSSWSYLEYIRIMGYPLAPDSLLLDDKDGSRSHRNGLCKVLGRDDLDWHESNPQFDGVYPQAMLDWLAEEGALLLQEAVSRANGHPWAPHVNYFTLESALCTYKSMFRPNRRYPMCYVDMLYDRIKWAEARWPEANFSLFWDARTRLPDDARLELNRADVGLKPAKQNHFLETGEMICMDEGFGGWRCFSNAYNDRVRIAQASDQAEEFALR